MSEIISLFQLNQLIRNVIEQSMPDTFLVTAEIASCDVKNHCYLTLVDKEEDTIRAEIKAVIWAGRYKAIAKVFEKETGTTLSKGIKILFHPPDKKAGARHPVSGPVTGSAPRD